MSGSYESDLLATIRKREKKIHSDGERERVSQEKKRKQEGRGRLKSHKELNGHLELSTQVLPQLSY